MKILWLDDVRDPFLESYQIRYPSLEEADDITWIKSYWEFTDYIEKFGMPDMIYFDHDLGNDKTGYDCMKWLVEYIMDNKTESLPEVRSQSDNPVGRDNILMCWHNFLKHRQTMEISELMIGDWVYDKFNTGFPIQIDAIDNNYWYEG